MGKQTSQNYPSMMAEQGEVKRTAQPQTIYMDSLDSLSEEAASQKHPLWANLETAVLLAPITTASPPPAHPILGD